jgi:hypothetical protein
LMSATAVNARSDRSSREESCQDTMAGNMAGLRRIGLRDRGGRV